MVKVVAENTLKRIEDLEGILDSYKELIEKTREEKGCISYDLFQGLKDAKSIIMVEEWETLEDLQNHSKSEHFLKIVPKLEEYMVGEGKVNIYKKLI